jgi:hypothetical protein
VHALCITSSSCNARALTAQRHQETSCRTTDSTMVHSEPWSMHSLDALCAPTTPIAFISIRTYHRLAYPGDTIQSVDSQTIAPFTINLVHRQCTQTHACSYNYYQHGFNHHAPSVHSALVCTCPAVNTCHACAPTADMHSAYTP